MSKINSKQKTTVNSFLKKKQKGEKIAVLTAYDCFTAQLLDQAGINALLVGDSVGNVLHGFENTLPVTMDMMLMHTAAVARGTTQALVIADMPFMSFQPSIETAVRNAGRFMQEAGAEAVKVEGGLEMVSQIKRLVECGIPVMGHIGLTPQSINRFGGPKIQGKDKPSRDYLIQSALALEDVGCFSMVLELVNAEVAGEITRSLKRAATIGIGAGPDCDGQVLVINDILGLREEAFRPKFLREYANLSPQILKAVKAYVDDVKKGTYPDKNESY